MKGTHAVCVAALLTAGCGLSSKQEAQTREIAREEAKKAIDAEIAAQARRVAAQESANLKERIPTDAEIKANEDLADKLEGVAAGGADDPWMKPAPREKR